MCNAAEDIIDTAYRARLDCGMHLDTQLLCFAARLARTLAGEGEVDFVTRGIAEAPFHPHPCGA